MEQEPSTEHVESHEDVEAIIERLYNRERELYEKYKELFGEPSEEISDWSYAVSMGAIASSWSNEEIRKNLEEFNAFLEAEIAEKSDADKP